MDRLPQKELELVKAIWDSEEPISVKEITQKIEEMNETKYSRTTISTWISRLKNRGFIERVPDKKGLYAYYRAKISKKEYLAVEMKSFLEFWCKGSVTEWFKELKEFDLVNQEMMDELKKELN